MKNGCVFIRLFPADSGQGCLHRQVPCQTLQHSFSARRSSSPLWDAISSSVPTHKASGFLQSWDTWLLFSTAPQRYTVSATTGYQHRKEPALHWLQLKTIRGSVSVDLPLKSKNEWIITRTDVPPETPVLVSTHGLPVSAVTAENKSISFTAERSGSYPIKWNGTGPVQFYVNGKAVKTGTIPDLTVKTGDRITIKQK